MFTRFLPSLSFKCLWSKIDTTKRFLEAQTPLLGSLINKTKGTLTNSYSGANGTGPWKSAWPDGQMAQG